MALTLMAACSKPDVASGGQLTVLLDSMDVPTGMEVVALSAPAPSEQPAPKSTASVGRARADSVALYHHAADSASTLDAAFQRERAALNSEAAALDASDRRATDYARRFDAFSPRRQAAEQLRSERDRARSRAAALASRLPASSLRTEGAAITPSPTAVASTSVAARHAAPAVRPATSLELPAGTWWIGLARAGAAPRTTVRIAVHDGARDTVRITPSRREVP